ncbi:ribosomal protein S6 kinase 2 beta-like [Dendrobates tinctorius]|uniref:ribosomal protein S6 kinase 2 beta-like n=1 Tax=Dendrobates tinctorius TaxID=92724 RepID=UPI003CC94A7D
MSSTDMGTILLIMVVLASVPGHNINVAVKMITKRDNEDTIMRERRILLAARDCPFLCHLYAAHQSQHRAYFITEYLSGGSLEDLIKMCGCLNIGNVRFYTAEMVCGLQFLHRHNIVHRDIKPDNIMLDADGHIRIIDLGFAQDGVSSSKNISGVTGTFHYMAPEVLHRKRYGAAVDWWSLGIVVSRMAAGRSPFYNGPVKQMAFKAIINEKPKFPSWLDADVKHLINRLLRKDPQTRLGVSGNIREHPFFTTIGWKDLEERRAEPPFTPFRPVLENHHLQWPEHTVLHPVDEKISIVKESMTIWMSPCQLPGTSCLLIRASCPCCCTSPRLPFNINSLYTIFLPDHCHCCPRPLTLPPPILGWILTSFQPQERPVLTFHLVVLASVPGRNINVAVKMITKRDNEDTIMRERRILLASRDCPFLCHLYAAHQSQHRAYFITEYLSGGSLEDLIKMCGCLNIGNVRFYTAEMVCGLQFLHGHNIIHRDIKPDNIMLDADGHIRIIDLGLAQDGVSSSKNISGVTGTFHYMAPEVLRRKRYGAAVDWWSLGIVVSRMAAGRSPFYNGPFKQMAFKAIINEKPKFPSWLDADVKHLINRLLRKDPQTRLGVSGNIREHPFFTTIGWKDLEERRAEPPFTPFRPVLENHHLQWPEHTVLHPVAGFTYMSPSWAR